MKALQIADAEVMRIALQQEISRSDESRYDHRLHGVLLVGQGHSCYEVGGWFGEHPTTIERWVHRFEHRGFAGLREGERKAALGGWTTKLGGRSNMTCAGIRATWVTDRTFGMANCWPIICGNGMRRSWGSANASGCFGAWAFGGESPVR